jgi:hypothetical protein
MAIANLDHKEIRSGCHHAPLPDGSAPIFDRLDARFAFHEIVLSGLKGSNSDLIIAIFNLSIPGHNRKEPPDAREAFGVSPDKKPT